MTSWPVFWTALCGVIQAAWPEVDGPTHPIARVTQMERRPWRELTQDGRLASPRIIVQIPPTQQAEGWGGANVVYRPRVMVYYVTANNAAPDIAAVVEAKLADLETALVNYTGEAFQLMYNFGYDVSEENAANNVFTDKNMPFFGGMLAFDVMFGYVPGN